MIGGELKERSFEKNRLFSSSEGLYMENRKNFLGFFVKDGPGTSLLDFGCNDGSFTIEIAKAADAGDVYGLEINLKQAAKAKKRGIVVRPGDLNKRLPFHSGTFDVISANQVLEHVWNTHNFFAESNRLLKKGGYMVVSVPNMSSLHSILFILMGQQTPVVHLVDKQVGNFLRGTKVSWPSHAKAFNIPALRDLAELYGFKVEKISGFGVYFFPKPLQKIASRALGRYSIYVTMRARKVREYKGK